MQYSSLPVVVATVRYGCSYICTKQQWTINQKHFISQRASLLRHIPSSTVCLWEGLIMDPQKDRILLEVHNIKLFAEEMCSQNRLSGDCPAPFSLTQPC